MRGRYEVEDLLKLRASPLVAKPVGLPPIEDWMGLSEPRARVPSGRARLEDSLAQTEGFQKRPNLQESRRSTTDPERIHLGPPRHSFASSNARVRNGTHERTKTNEENPDASVRRSATFAGLNGKNEINSYERPRRYNEAEDDEVRPRRGHDRPRWGPREKDKDSHADPPWSKRDKRGDGDEDAERENPAWRRGLRTDRDHERIDPEPEWVDSTDTTEPSKAHTHEEFMQWMDKMKNKTVPDGPISQIDAAEKEPPVGVTERPLPRVISDSSASFDKFFTKFEEKKPVGEAQATGRPAKSRFASIFGSKDESKPESPSAPTALQNAYLPPPTAELEHAGMPDDRERKEKDAAAFSKLLEMLNRNQQNSTPTTLQSLPTKSPLNIAELASTRSPDVAPASTTKQQMTRTPVSTHTPNLSLDRLIESRSPAHQAQQKQQGAASATPQDLLDLLKRSSVQEKEAPRYPLSRDTGMIQGHPPPLPPGLGNYPDRDSDRQGPPLISTRRIFDDPAFASYRREPEYQQRSPPPAGADPSQGGLGAMFASMNTQNYRQSSPEEPRQGPTHVNPPPGLQRPPGLETGARPPPGSGWPTNPAQRPPMPMYGGDIQQPIFPPNRNAYPQPHAQPPPRQMPIRQATADMPIPPGFSNFPPGFGPSPNYTSPTSPDTNMQFAIRGGYNNGDRERIERERQQQQNAYLARLQGSNRGVQLPPGFR